MVVEAVYAAAVTLGLAAGLRGNRTAWPLLVGALVAHCLAWAGTPFSVKLWVALDLAMMAAIVWAPLSRWAVAILALFPVAWAAYVLPDPCRYMATAGIVSAQFALAFMECRNGA
jgi:hypothetical protein